MRTEILIDYKLIITRGAKCGASVSQVKWFGEEM